ncbi:hypothetical protein [Sphingopyxis sp.]|jgi:hypothetical protein|uniref:hypothetical protein n=1 Tax=Sphingopyxis sp. TaxID=1908224 RepID=UPI003F6F95E1
MGALQKIGTFFTRRPRPAPAADTWHADDMAECIADGPWADARGQLFEGLQRGHVVIVREVVIARNLLGRHGQFLGFARWPGVIFEARGFRKLTPRADAARAADASFINGLRHRRLVGPSLLDRIAARLAHRVERILP